ncbi:MAG: site-2 protease family protein [Candidatus Taylorbacteria bacterium]|nr:site-2 protease family protein [Candidatus Taylorbacteria bacterium]
MEASFIFSLVILIFSVVIHEISHGYAALIQGDRTAELEGRLTLNPIKHIDPVGSVILPVILALLPGGFMFGWAKPVPYNPYNLRNQRWGEAIVAFAGPLSNLVLATVFGLFLRFYALPGGIDSPVSMLAIQIVYINIALAVFNLVPMPPLDGSKILTAILPQGWMKVRESIERFGFVGVFIFLIFLWQFFAPLIPWLFRLITGI